MKLKTRLFLIFVLAFATISTTNTIIQYKFIYPKFQALERREAEKNLTRCIQTIETEVWHLQALCHDWASWDDTFAFILDKNPAYIKSNLGLETFVDAKLNAIYYYDRDGQPVWSRCLDLNTREPMVLKDLVVAKLRPGHPLYLNLEALAAEPDISKSGLLNTSYGLMTFASRPILNSENKGPARGTLVMGRLISPEVLDKFRDQTQVDFSLNSIAMDGSVEPRPPGILEMSSETKSTIQASMAMEDILGNPSIEIAATIDREIVRQGFATVRTSRAVAIGVGMVVLVIIMWVLAVTLVKPMTALTEHVLMIRHTKDLSVKLNSDRKDEIGILASEFDQMLETIRRQSVELEEDLVIRKRIADELGESMHKYKLLAENLKDVVVSLSTDGYVNYSSPAIVEFGGYTPEEEVGRHVRHYLYRDRDKVEADAFLAYTTKTKENQSVEFLFMPKDGAPFPVEMSAKPVVEDGVVVSIQCVLRDISERKKAEKDKARLEAQLRQAHKMEAIGTLAGGIAHDFNNVLYPIMGFTEMAMMDLEEDASAHENLREVLDAADRAKKLVRQIMAFSSHGKDEPKPVLLESIVEDVLSLIRASLPSTIDIKDEFKKIGRVIYADPIEIHQVLMNICSNASYAMKDTGGILELTLSDQVITKYDLTPAQKITPGRYARLSISDDGPGMTREVMDRIFEPYFTTKPVGQGSGMGLAVAHALVSKYGGDLRAYSEIGRGSSFHIYFPLMDQDAKESVSSVTQVIPKGNEHVLLVDDEEQILRMTHQILERLGYQVTATSNSLEALETFRASPRTYDAIITDMTMPHLTGDDLATESLQIRPDVPVILCTGFSEKLTRKRAKEIGISAYVMKPVVMTQIASTLRDVLDNHPKRP